VGDTPNPSAKSGDTPNLPGSPAWLEDLVRSRLGPGASLGTFGFEGRLLRIEGATLPLGRGNSIHVARADVELGAGLQIGDLPLSVRLAALRGEVRGPVEDGGSTGSAPKRPTLSLPIDFTGSNEATPAWARGTLRVGPAGSLPGGVAFTGTLAFDLTAAGSLGDPRIHGRVTGAGVHLRGPGDAELDLDTLALTLEADRHGVRWRDIEASAGEARLGGWGEVLGPGGGPLSRRSPVVALRIERAGAALLGAIAGRRAPRLPPDMVVEGELSVIPAGALHGSFSLETPRSRLHLRLAIDGAGSLLGSTLRGRLSAEDAVTVGLIPSSLLRRGADLVAVDARLGGTLSRPAITGRLSATTLGLGVGPVLIEVADASVLLDAGDHGLSWSDLHGRLYGGSVTSSGSLGRGTGALDALVAWSGVRVEEVPTAPSGRSAVAGVLAGASSGNVHFTRTGLTEHSLTAVGAISVADPVYSGVRRFAADLRRYGLPPVDRRGKGPLNAFLRLARGEIVIEPIAAALDGIDVEAELTIQERGDHLVGRARIHLLASYLSRSALLSLPAVLSGKVTIPVYVRGRPGALQVRTDALEILDGLLRGGRARGAVKGVLDGILGAVRPRPRRRG
jgi:hypothetical protein